MPSDVSDGMATLLDGSRGNARDRLSILLEIGEIPDHEDFRVARNRQIGLHFHSTDPIERHPEKATDR